MDKNFKILDARSVWLTYTNSRLSVSWVQNTSGSASIGLYEDQGTDDHSAIYLGGTYQHGVEPEVKPLPYGYWYAVTITDVPLGTNTYDFPLDLDETILSGKNINSTKYRVIVYTSWDGKISGGVPLEITNQTPAVPPSPPTNTLAPSITGSTQNGNNISITLPATWNTTGSPVYTYQWQRAWSGPPTIISTPNNAVIPGYTNNNFASLGQTNYSNNMNGIVTILKIKYMNNPVPIPGASPGFTIANWYQSDGTNMIMESSATVSYNGGTPSTYNHDTVLVYNNQDYYDFVFTASSTGNGSYANASISFRVNIQDYQNAGSQNAGDYTNFTITHMGNQYGNLGGHTSQSYTSQSNDSNYNIRVLVTCTDDGGITQVASNAIGPII